MPIIKLTEGPRILETAISLNRSAATGAVRGTLTVDFHFNGTYDEAVGPYDDSILNAGYAFARVLVGAIARAHAELIAEKGK